MKAAGPVFEIVKAQLFARARRVERHPHERRERQIDFSWRRTRRVPVEEADQPVAVHHRVVRSRILVTDDPPGLHRATGEPPLIRWRDELSCHVVDASKPLANLYQSRVGKRPRRPGNTIADHFSRQEGEHLASLVVEAERAGYAFNAGVLQVPQQRVYRRCPRRGLLVHDVTDPHGADGVAARQVLLAHWCFIPGVERRRYRVWTDSRSKPSQHPAEQCEGKVRHLSLDDPRYPQPTANWPGTGSRTAELP